MILRDSPNESPAHSGDLIDIRSSKSDDSAKYRELLSSIWLYVDWRWLTMQLTTEQKELWADAIDTTSAGDEFRVERWWRA